MLVPPVPVEVAPVVEGGATAGDGARERLVGEASPPAAQQRDEPRPRPRPRPRLALQRPTTTPAFSARKRRIQRTPYSRR